MIKYMRLEWKKLDTKNVLAEVWIYLIILMLLPTFFIMKVLPVFGESYALAIELNGYIQLGFVLFGASLINHVFIEQYKNKTMALSFSYPVSRKTLFTSKILFIAVAVFVVSIISYLLSGLSTYVLNLFFSFIEGQITVSELMSFFSRMLIGSVLNSIICFIPLFLFGIWKRAVVPTIVCSLASMQLPNFSSYIHVQPESIMIVLTVLGVISIAASIMTAEKVGEI